MGKRRSRSAAEAAAGVRGGAVTELPVEVAAGVGAHARRVRAPAAGGCGEAAALGAVHARELEPRVDARELHAPHAAELRRYDANLRQTPTRDSWALLPTVGSRSVGLGPRCGLRSSVARMRTGRALALGGAARSRSAHHNYDSPSRRSVRSTSDQNCGFSRRTTRAAL